MKINFLVLRSLALLSLAGGVWMAPALAQTPATPALMAPAATQAEQWEKLAQVNAPIRACHVVWRRVQRLAAQPANDPEQQAQGMMESARQQGMSEAEIQEVGASERKFAFESRKERVIESTLDFVRIGKVVLCNVNMPAPEYQSDYIEYADGIDSLHAQTAARGKPDKHPGTALQRNSNEVLYMSAGGTHRARFLVGLPLSQSLGPSNPILESKDANLKILPDGIWLVERAARFVNRRSVEPDDLTFGGDGAYLKSYEKFDVSMVLGNGKVTMNKAGSQEKVVASDFKEYPGGVWFPSQITSRQGIMTTQYSLVEAQFNEAVDPNGLLLPPNLRVTDLRFGNKGGNTPVYTTTDGLLPTDEAVKAKMGGR